MDYLPIFLQVRGQRCIVIGGGEVAARKVALLEKARASIAIVSPVLGETLREACNDGRVEHLATTFVPQHLTGAKLVIAATGRKEVNQAVAVAARERNVPVNVVDDPTNCEFIMPAIVDRSPLVVAISSAGQAPVLARRIREKIETMLPAKFGLFVEWAGSLRSKVAARLPESRRRWFWERLMDSPAVERIIADDIDGAADIAALMLEQDHAPGHVSLVGAGPGDPDLLTLKALRALQTADVIVHDRLVSAPVLDLARRDAERINVGKAMNRHLLPQEEINALLIELASQGRQVVRLKGGDPFIFGRGGEEAEALAAAGISFSVVPGISAMSGVAASCSIPLTHRDYADQLRVITGHCCNNNSLDCDWHDLARTKQTVVFYMGLSNLNEIASELIAAGAPASRPAALVANATRDSERVIISTLDSLPDLAARTEVKSPALIIIGDVVAVRARLVIENDDVKDLLVSATA